MSLRHKARSVLEISSSDCAKLAGRADNRRPPTDAARAGCCHAPETANKPQSPGCSVPIGQKSTPFFNRCDNVSPLFCPWSVLVSEALTLPLFTNPPSRPRAGSEMLDSGSTNSTNN